MENKRGLSDIVATVLIVLLALAAVAIVWGFLRPMFDNAAQTTDLRSRCFSVDVQPNYCSYDATTLTVRARNMAGTAKYITFVANGPNGDTIQSWNNVEAGELLGTVSQTATGSYTDGSIKELTVAGVVEDDAGDTYACPGTTIACIGTGF